MSFASSRRICRRVCFRFGVFVISSVVHSQGSLCKIASNNFHIHYCIKVSLYKYWNCLGLFCRQRMLKLHSIAPLFIKNGSQYKWYTVILQRGNKEVASDSLWIRKICSGYNCAQCTRSLSNQWTLKKQKICNYFIHWTEEFTSLLV